MRFDKLSCFDYPAINVEETVEKKEIIKKKQWPSDQMKHMDFDSDAFHPFSTSIPRISSSND